MPSGNNGSVIMGRTCAIDDTVRVHKKDCICAIMVLSESIK